MGLDWLARAPEPGWRKVAGVTWEDGREATIWIDEAGRTYVTTGFGGTWFAPSSGLVQLPVREVTLVVGEVPDGAVEVQFAPDVSVRESLVAGGKLLAVLDRRWTSALPAVYRDAQGEVVPQPPAGEELARRPVPDADVPCPACGCGEWDAVEIRAEPEDPCTRWKATVCRRCGHTQSGWTSAGRRRPGHAERDPDWAYPKPPAGLPEHPEHPTAVQVVEATTFPVYALAVDLAHRAELGQWSWTERGIASVTLRHRLSRAGDQERVVEVTSTAEWNSLPAPLVELARFALAGLFAPARGREDPLWQLSEEARELRRGHDSESDRRRANDAPFRDLELPAGHNTLTFTLVEDPEGSWAAVARTAETTVTITGTQIDPWTLALEVLTDPAAYFHATRERPRSKRTAR